MILEETTLRTEYLAARAAGLDTIRRDGSFPYPSRSRRPREPLGLLGRRREPAWTFGMDRGWEEITRGADIRVPRFFRFVIRWVTPVFILLVLVGALFQPMGRGWEAAFSKLFAGDGWPFAPESVIGRLLHVGEAAHVWFDPSGMPTRGMVIDLTRLLLLAVFTTLAVLVWYAWRRKRAPR